MRIHFGLSRLVRLYKNYSISMSGDKGSGKDLITNNVIVRRKQPHVSNLPTHLPNYYPFDYSKIDTKCIYKDLVSENIPHYVYPYPMGTDIYLSDCGIYFPSQFCNELNRDYKSFPTFIALSRQLGGDAKVHFNSQSCSRTWDKIREMSDRFLRCRKTIKLPFGFFLTYMTEYDRYDSCVARIRPCRIPFGGFDAQSRMMSRIARDNYFNKHGKVVDHIYIYKNRAKYDTMYFGALFGGEEFESKRKPKKAKAS